MVNECPFCIERESKRRFIYESEYSFMILSNPCLMKGHSLVIPKRHVEKLSELKPAELIDLFNLIVKGEEQLLKKFPGCDVRQNYRPFQKQDGLKVNHLHVHLQPREPIDRLYERCQVYEKDVFKRLSSDELDGVRRFILD